MRRWFSPGTDSFQSWGAYTRISEWFCSVIECANSSVRDMCAHRGSRPFFVGLADRLDYPLMFFLHPSQAFFVARQREMTGDVHAVEDVYGQRVERLDKQLIAGGCCNCPVEANVFFNAEQSGRIGLVQMLESFVDCRE